MEIEVEGFVTYEELYSRALRGGDFGYITTGKELKSARPGSYTILGRAKGDPKKGNGNYYLIKTNIPDE